MKVQGHSFVHSLVCLHHSHVCLLHTVCFAHPFSCAHSFACLLTHSFLSSWESEWLDSYFCCVFFCSGPWCTAKASQAGSDHRRKSGIQSVFESLSPIFAIIAFVALWRVLSHLTAFSNLPPFYIRLARLFPFFFSYFSFSFSFFPFLLFLNFFSDPPFISFAGRKKERKVEEKRRRCGCFDRRCIWS